VRHHKIFSLFAISAATILSACNAMNNNNTEPQKVFAQVGEGTACEAMDNVSCSGRFGFQIDSAGNFTAGPSFVQKVSVHGTITASELSALAIVANTYLGSASGSKFCFGGATIPGAGEVVTITKVGATDPSVVLSTLPDPVSCLQADPNATKALVAEIDQLRQKYYPVPFPGE